MQILVPVLPLLLCDFEEDTSLSGLSLHPGDVRDLDNELPCPAEHSVCPQGPVLTSSGISVFAPRSGHRAWKRSKAMLLA